MAVVRPATADDLDEWLEIVREFEPLAGPMPDFSGHALRGIARGTALVVSDNGRIDGACLLSPDTAPREIRWIAIRAGSRRRGLGSMLLEAIERRWPDGDISVITFADSIADGEPARRFYESRGFELRGEAPPAPDGGARILYVLPANRRVKR